MGTSGRGCCLSLRFNLLDLNISRAVSAESPKDENESLVLATATDVLETQVVFGVDGRKNDVRFSKREKFERLFILQTKARAALKHLFWENTAVHLHLLSRCLA